MLNHVISFYRFFLRSVTDVLSKFIPCVSADDVSKLLVKFDRQNNDTFSYNEFLRHFALMAPRREKTESLLRREKMTQKRVSVRKLYAHTFF